jgi:trehalose/maltose transport system substrate-binding protein
MYKGGVLLTSTVRYAVGVGDRLLNRRGPTLKTESVAFRQAHVCVFAGLAILAVLTWESCGRSGTPAPPVTLKLIDQTWVEPGSRRFRDEELLTFTKETGISVEVLPSPESADDQIAVWQQLLESHATVPDVYAVDVIWPGILAENLLDLKPYIPAQEITAHFPKLIANNTVDGRLVALPYTMNAGLLFYRVDLLRKYGYRTPPKTWEALESMARRIQEGERAKGRKNFWGFVWQGAASEALTCNALEWQVAEGGGTIIENGTITVNNPRATEAWERAARWVGSISPPGVVSYKEWDTFNVWQAGEAAFMRNWAGSSYVAVTVQASPKGQPFDMSPLPRGQAGTSSTLGGNSYAVSRYSLHPREAAMLVRFLGRRNEQLRRCRQACEPPTIPELYSDPEVLAANPYLLTVLEIGKNLTLRPSTASGKEYPKVSRAYFDAVHAVLTGKKTTTKAAADLQDKLVQLTNFKVPATDSNKRFGNATATGLR